MKNKSGTNLKIVGNVKTLPKVSYSLPPPRYERVFRFFHPIDLQKEIKAVLDKLEPVSEYTRL